MKGKGTPINQTLLDSIIMDRISDAFVSLDENWNFTFVNKKAAEIMGRDSKVLIGKQLWTEFPEVVGQPFEHAFLKAMETQEFQQIREYYPPWDIWFENRIYPSNDGISIFFNDITDQIVAEKELTENRQFTRKILDSMNDGLSILDPNGVHISVNKAFCEMTGYTEDELVGKGVPHPYWSENHMDEIVSAFQQAQTDTIRDLHLHFQRKNGQVFPVIVSPAKIYDEDGNVTQLFATVKDISELYDAQNQIAVNKQRMNVVLESSGLGIWDYDLTTKKTTRTLKHDECFGLSEYHPNWNHDAFIGFVIEEDHDLVNSVYPDYLAKGKGYDLDYRVRWDDGSIHWLNSTGRGIYNESGELQRIIGTVREITEKKENELAIQDSNREKETLLAEIHHRVKNNLAVVAGLMYLQTKDTDNPDLVERLSINIDRIKSIAAIHEELYKSHNYSRISFSSNIRKVVENLNTVSFSSKNVSINLNLEEVFLEISNALPAALIVNEILTNAFKHAFDGIEEPKIAIDLSKTGKTVKLVISDNGVGLPKNFKPNASLSIGLNLVNSLADQLEGDFDLANQDGLTCTLSFNSIF